MKLCFYNRRNYATFCALDLVLTSFDVTLMNMEKTVGLRPLPLKALFAISVKQNIDGVMVSQLYGMLEKVVIWNSQNGFGIEL